jgi:hypothetical protein
VNLDAPVKHLMMNSTKEYEGFNSSKGASNVEVSRQIVNNNGEGEGKES